MITLGIVWFDPEKVLIALCVLSGLGIIVSFVRLCFCIVRVCVFDARNCVENH